LKSPYATSAVPINMNGAALLPLQRSVATPTITGPDVAQMGDV